MKKFFVLLFCCLWSMIVNGQEVYVSGCANGMVARVDYLTGQVLWQRDVPAPEDCNDIKVYDEGVLYAYRQGARLVRESGEVVWDYRVPAECEVYSARQIKGGYMIAMCAPEKPIIVWLNDEGEEQRRVSFDVGVGDIHSQIRHVVSASDNRCLVPVMGRGEVVEVDANTGEVLRCLSVGGTPFSMSQSPKNKNIWWVACGDGAKVVAIDVKKWQVVREIANENLSGADIKMLFVGEVMELNGGRLMVANWNGHVSDKSQPKLFVIDQKGKVLSSLPNNKAVKNISTFDIKRK